MISAAERDQLKRLYNSPSLYAEETSSKRRDLRIHTPRLSHVRLTMAFCFLSACRFLWSHLHGRLGHEIRVRLQGRKLNNITSLKETIKSSVAINFVLGKGTVTNLVLLHLIFQRFAYTHDGGGRQEVEVELLHKRSPHIYFIN